MATRKKSPQKIDTNKDKYSDHLSVIISLIIAIMLAIGSTVFPVSFHISKLLFFVAFIILGLFLHYLKYINYIALFIYIIIFGALSIFVNKFPFSNINFDPQKVKTNSVIDTTESKPIIKSSNKNISQHNSPGAILDASTTTVTSVNQQGGIIANKVTIDEFPKPIYSLEFINKNIPTDSLFKTEARLSIKSKTVVPSLYVTCKTPSMVNMKITPEGDRMMKSLKGYYKTTDGFPVEMIQDAFGSYLISITSSKPDKPIILFKDSYNIESH